MARSLTPLRQERLGLQPGTRSSQANPEDQPSNGMSLGCCGGCSMTLLTASMGIATNGNPQKDRSWKNPTQLVVNYTFLFVLGGTKSRTTHDDTKIRHGTERKMVLEDVSR